jgi:signal transduction histidine kinase
LADSAPFESLVLQLREHVGLLDTTGNLRWANASLADSLGRPAGDIASEAGGLPPLHWLSSTSLPPLMRALAAIGTGFTPPGERITIQIEVIGIEGPRSCLGSVQLLEGAGRVALIARPVDQQSDQSLHASQADFLANLSHELRTPLLAILGYSELLVRTGFGAWTDDQQRYARDVLDSGRNLLRQIEDVLEFAKVRSGRMTLQVGPVALDDLLTSCLGTAKALAFERELNISVELDGPLGVLQTDERLLRHAILNLLSNAIKFTPNGGQVQLAARLKGPWAQIAVRDTGIGIDTDEVTRIFGAFYQVDSGTERRAGGTGLGLAIVTRFVELLGGGIRLHSRPGVGSTFTLHVPVRTQTDPMTDDEPSMMAFGLDSIAGILQEDELG